jgi:hypothetical protein
MRKNQQFAITVPFNNTVNAQSQTFNSANCKRSKFQVQTLLEISQHPHFAFFVTQAMRNNQAIIVAPNYSCHFEVHFFLTSGKSHMLRIDRESFTEIYATSGNPYIHTPRP